VVPKCDSNVQWKNEINLGKKTNQNFVSIPHARLIEMLKYKAELMGIEVIEQEESYTSKSNFLNGVYNQARFDLAIDYCQEPRPPLKAADREWADNLLRQQGRRL
jgi:hypothetical protein